MKIRLGAKHDFLRRYGIAVGWSVTSLGDIADIVGGGTPSREDSRFWNGGTIPWATPTDITSNNHKFIRKTAEYITEAGLKSSAANLLPEGSILFTSRATIGAKAIAGVPMATNQGFASLRPAMVDRDYLYYLLDLLTPAIKRLGAGTTFDEISKRDMRTVWLTLPKIPDEQHAIAKTLNSIESEMDRALEAEGKAKVLKYAILQHFFYSALGETAYADSPKKKLSQGWSLVATEALLSGDPKNGNSPQASSQPPGIPTFSIAAVRDGRIDLDNSENLKYVQMPEKAAVRYRVKRGDVLIVRGNANPDLVGKAGMIERFPDRCIYPDITMRVIFRPDGATVVTPEYAVLAWNHPVVHNQVLRRAKTSNGTLKINSRDVKQIIMPVPPMDEQKKLVRLIAGVDAKIDALNQVCRAQEVLKRSLMQDLLTGKVRLKISELGGRA